MILILLLRHLIHFCILIVLIACIYMYATIEDTNPQDFDLELQQQYKTANEYVNKNKGYYYGVYQFPLIGALPGFDNNALLAVAKNAKDEQEERYKGFRTESIAPGFVMINPLYVEL
jgi:hypothetical protein